MEKYEKTGIAVAVVGAVTVIVLALIAAWALVRIFG